MHISCLLKYNSSNLLSCTSHTWLFISFLARVLVTQGGAGGRQEQGGEPEEGLHRQGDRFLPQHRIAGAPDDGQPRHRNTRRARDARQGELLARLLQVFRLGWKKTPFCGSFAKLAGQPPWLYKIEIQHFSKVLKDFKDIRGTQTTKNSQTQTCQPLTMFNRPHRNTI